MKPTPEQFAAYQGIFDYFNIRLFQKTLPDCILNLSRLKNSHGFFSPQRWKNETGTELHEISLNPDTLSREPKKVISTLVHEMCHLWQQEFGTPPRKAYHNKQFASKMKEVGLYPSNTGEPGGKETGQNMSHYIVENGPFDRHYNKMPKTLLLPFTAIPNIENEKKKKSSNKVKYSCPDCETNVWGKPDLNIICGDCETQFQPEENED